MNDKIQIYQVVHRNYKNLPVLDGYVPLFVGAWNKDNIPCNYLRDDFGDNISYKNNAYCELTGLYWIWKNVNADIVGLVHYRRYFGNYDDIFHYRTYHLARASKYHILTDDEIFRKFSLGGGAENLSKMQ